MCVPPSRIPLGAVLLDGDGLVTVIEPDELGPDDYHPMDPAGSSPLVAWLASDESQLITGQVIRAIHDKLYLMKGWREAASASAGDKRWKAEQLGAVVATQLFGTRAAGLG